MSKAGLLPGVGKLTLLCLSIKAVSLDGRLRLGDL